MAVKLMDILYQAGFRGNGLRMAYAIAMAESGGNATASNSVGNSAGTDRGLFQLNSYYHSEVSDKEAYDALANAKAAYRISHGGTNWSAWSSFHNNSYKQFLGGTNATLRNYKGAAPSSAPSSSSGGGGGDAPKDPKATAEDYGYVIGLMNSDPELKSLFKKAVDKGWATEKFQAELRDTKWWKSHSQQERDFLTKRYGDPASAKQEYNQAFIHVRQLAASLGIVETPQNMTRMKTWAYNVAAKGWTDDQLRYDIGMHLSFSGDTWQGQGGEVQQKLHEYAYNMGVKMSNQWYADKSRAVVRGIATEQDYQSEIRKQAKTLFPQWSKQIDAGQSVADLASPYFQSMAQILEIPPGSINLFDPKIKAALQYKDPKTGQGTAKPLWQFENDMRSDPRWKKTQNAQNSLMQVAHQVLSDFGLKF